MKINADTVIDTSAGNGAVKFTSTLNGADATNRALTVKSGSGKVTVEGITGGTFDLGTFKINDQGGSGQIELFDIGDSGNTGSGATTIGNANTSKIILDGVLYRPGGTTKFTATTGSGTDNDTITVTRGAAGAGDADFVMGANSLEFAGGAVKLSNDVNLDIDGTGAVTIAALEGTSSETVTITTTTTTLGTVGTNTTTGIGDITVNGSTSANNGGIVLTGDITSFVSGGKTGGEQVQFTGAVVIKGDVTITTDASSGANGTADDGKIRFRTKRNNSWPYIRNDCTYFIKWSWSSRA